MITQFFQGIANQGFSTYLGPLQEQFGWSRAVLAGPRSVTQVENSVLGPVEGYLVDKFGPRRMVAAGTFVMGLGLILFGLTQSLWLYYVSNIIIALGTGFQGILVMSVAVNNWFRRKRSIAQSVMLLGFTMAGVVAVPLLVLVQTNINWQTSAIGSGLLIWAFGFPCSLLLRTSPEAYGLLPDGDTSGGATGHNSVGERQSTVEYDFTLREAIRTRAFWLLAIGSAVSNLGMGAAQVHLFLHLEQGVGLARPTAALVWMVASLANIPSRLAGGFLGDRLPKNLMVGLSMVFMAVSLFVLGMATSLQMAFVYAVLYGIGWGMRTPVINAMQGEYFGRKSQGVIRGWLQTVSLPFTIAAPVIAGYIADLQGNYKWTFIIMSFVSLVGAALIFITTAPKSPLDKQAALNAER
ncbi:MAG: MFS transporter [Chloroflexi bacterium]|nr:MFS transporter [Chloroflexota bacterium]